MIIAIDGPAGAGKSSTARAVAKRLGFRHLDSGAFYRALTYAALRHGMQPDTWDGLDPARLDALRVEGQPSADGFRLLCAGMDVSGHLREAEVTANVSRMAGVAAVRDWLLDRLRAASRGVDLVADGRDIGTVVFPDAELKVFLVADPVERARRRRGGRVLARGVRGDARDVRGDAVEHRGRRDREGAVLRVTENAVILDVGFKSEGAITKDEFKNPELLKPGDEVEVFLENLEDPTASSSCRRRRPTSCASGRRSRRRTRRTRRCRAC
jgi:CMP/dCMP kinase